MTDTRMTTLVVDREGLARIIGTLRFAAADFSDQAAGRSDDPHAASQMLIRSRQITEDADMLVKSIVPDGDAVRGIAA
jgi:hypothetical protein